LHSCLFWNWLFDDAGISFAYARNLMHGFGLVTQPGAEPVEGFSNPLWTFIMAPLFISPPSDPTLAVKLISGILILLTFIVLNRVVPLLLPDSDTFRLVSFYILLALSLNTSFVVWTTSGLENALHILLCSLYLLVCLNFAHLQKTGISSSLKAGLLAAGLALNRPDGIIFVLVFPLLVTVLLAQRKLDRKEAFRFFGSFLVLALIPIALYQFFRIWYFADPFPMAYHVKGGPAVRDVIHLITFHSRYVYKTLALLNSITTANGIVILLLLAAFYGLAMFQARDRVPLLIPMILLICSWAVYCLLPADWMGEYRFATTFFAMFYLCFFISAARAMMLLKSFVPHWQNVIFGLLAFSFLISTTMTYISRSLSFSTKPTAPFSEVAGNALAFNEYGSILQVPSSTWLCPDLGASLYYSRHRVYDLTGLCDRTFARLAHQKSIHFRNYVFDSLRPSFIHLHGAWSIRTGLQLDERFRVAYVPLQEIPFTATVNGRQVTYFHGDYIRRDVVSSSNLLEDLRRKIGPDFVKRLNVDRQAFPFVQ
jgi:hypothetical protein